MSRSEKLANKVAAVSAKLAGGGVTKYADPAKFDIDNFETPVLEALKTVYKQLDSKTQSFDVFLRNMASEESNAIGAAHEQNLSHPLSNYFISSSHNTYLTGHQLYGRANVDGYKNVSSFTQAEVMRKLTVSRFCFEDVGRSRLMYGVC